MLFSRESLGDLQQAVVLSRVLADLDIEHRSAYKCPLCGSFHLMIDEEDRNYRCYACDDEGDSIKLVMSVGEASFEGAVTVLAEMFHVSLEEVGSSNATKELVDLAMDLDDVMMRELLTMLVRKSFDEEQKSVQKKKKKKKGAGKAKKPKKKGKSSAKSS